MNKCLAFVLFLLYSLSGLDFGIAQTNTPQIEPTAPTQKSASSGKRTKAPPKQMPSSTAGLTGKVFLITKGGDLKEARFASLFVLSGDAVVQFRATLLHWQEWVTEQDSDVEKEITDRSSVADLQALHCGVGLVNVQNELVNLSKQQFANLLQSNTADVVNPETDEVGAFNVKGLKPGMYTVAVIGRAGVNTALWIEDVSLESGKDTAVKMHSPSMACSGF